ncbi:hypothetical protein [Methanolobus bombayensis]|uniref:hypothetical protein n=1 Tax=Methanolobus bombayensis TaxID=38023 RepID=UPI001AE52894|nr:hypothetical protein [Methanolobus bombayensis]MBP1910272.1 hypothetical protein [Methanolobus bombayensis]
MSDKKGIDRQIILILVFTVILVISALYYVEYREINDAYTLAGRVIDSSKDVDSYQFDIYSNISMLGESFMLMEGKGIVDYKNKEMSVSLLSMEDSMDLIVAEESAYSRNNNGLWDKQKLNQQMWDSYDQLTQTNLLLANSTELSMERTDFYLILTALPDNKTLLQEAEKAGLKLKGDERLTDYSIRYFIEKESYRVTAIESHTEFMMNVQGLVSPVAIHNRVEFYNYDNVDDVDVPVIAVQ